MKSAHLISIACCAVLFAGCESTNTAGRGNQEEKRLAAIEKEKENQHDEATRNLWNAQHDILIRDSNPAVHYY